LVLHLTFKDFKGHKVT
jgi:hypothetical protein